MVSKVIFNSAVGLCALSVIGAVAIYFYKFNGNLSIHSRDWAYFGSYIGGAVTLPLTAASLVVVYRNYKLLQASASEERFKYLQGLYLTALNNAVETVDRGLQHIFLPNNTNKQVSYLDGFVNSDYLRLLRNKMSEDTELAQARILIGKPLLGLYDMLVAYETECGKDLINRSIKIRYQFYYRIIHDDGLGILDNSYVSSEKMKEFFYQLDDEPNEQDGERDKVSSQVS